MWLLTCEGPLFNGKPLWLRPGSTHLLGRTTGHSEVGERIQYIDHKSVSRKHLTIEVGIPQPGDGTKLHVRSQITVTDGSKIGTTLNGDKFSREARTLTEKEYTIKLGSYEHLFHLKWRPVVLSSTSTSKKSKSEAYRAELELADVKLISEYITNETTHAIAKKRNTSAALQALCQAKWLVTEDFVQALVRAINRSGPENSSLLEDDYTANWPNEESFLVPNANEPKPTPDEYLRPNLERMEVFQHWLYIFLSQSQYDTLMPVITAGGGKALLWEVGVSESRVEDLVEYIKEVAGRKGSNDFRLSQHSEEGGIVVVRANDRDEQLREFMRAADLALDQRSIEQNEFLRAILLVDASGLRQPLEKTSRQSISHSHEQAASSHPQSQPQQPLARAVTVPDTPTPAPRELSQVQPQPVTEEPPQEQAAAKRRNRRFITQSRFTDFDDFDPSQFSKPASQSPVPSFDNGEPSQAPSVQSMGAEEPTQADRTQTNPRKRPAPIPDDLEDEEDMYANMLTAHTAMKRQKTAAAQSDGKNAMAQTSVEMERLAKAKTAKAKKKSKEIDVVAEMQARRKREDEERKKDEEALREALEGVDISDLKNLAKVEEMDVPVRERPARRADQNGISDRWDPTWNGRKNFKRFRPQGQQHEGPRLQRVIVTLEEVPRKGHGLGEEYWLSSTTTSRSKSKSQGQSQSTRSGGARSQPANGHDEDALGLNRRVQRSREEDHEDAIAQEIIPEEIAGRARDAQLEAAANSTPSQTLGTESQRRAAGKRPATSQAGGPAKKARQSRLPTSTRETVTLDDDDDDALKFRRRRR